MADRTNCIPLVSVTMSRAAPGHSGRAAHKDEVCVHGRGLRGAVGPSRVQRFEAVPSAPLTQLACVQVMAIVREDREAKQGAAIEAVAASPPSGDAATAAAPRDPARLEAGLSPTPPQPGGPPEAAAPPLAAGTGGMSEGWQQGVAQKRERIDGMLTALHVEARQGHGAWFPFKMVAGGCLGGDGALWQMRFSWLGPAHCCGGVFAHSLDTRVAHVAHNTCHTTHVTRVAHVPHNTCHEGGACPT
jgi:hypothetical protein